MMKRKYLLLALPILAAAACTGTVDTPTASPGGGGDLDADGGAAEEPATPTGQVKPGDTPPEGNEGAPGPVGEGSEGAEGAEGGEGTAEGAEGGAEGTEGSPEGAEGGNEGTEGGAEGPEGAAEGPEGAPAGCASDADCGGKACDASSGQCVECVDDSHCGADAACLEGKCEGLLPEVIPCKQDRDCPDELLVKCNTVIEQCVECLGNADCAAPKVCSDTGLCTEPDEGKCTVDSECDLGQICGQGDCVPGCNSSKDCTAGQKCDPARGQNGECVQCLADADCPEGGKCQGAQCVATCDADSDCKSGACDTAAHVCVDCNVNSQCPIGFTCKAHQCTPGCDSGKDCPDGVECIGGKCGGGCGGGAGCPEGQACDDVTGTCLASCQTNTDCTSSASPFCDTAKGLCFPCAPADGSGCTGGKICDPATHTCTACTADAQCGGGRTCINGACSQCSDDSACTDPGRPFCDANICVACRTSADCPGGGQCVGGQCVACQGDSDCPPELPVCEESAFSTPRCVVCNDDEQCADGEECSQFECKPDQDECSNDQQCPPEKPKCNTILFGNNRCVQCEADADCGPGKICDAAKVCQAKPPGPANCSPCQTDADCGGGNKCIQKTHEARDGTQDITVNFCGLACPDRQCESGWDCVNGFCEPGYASGGIGTLNAVATCEGYFDSLNKKACTPGSTIQAENECGLAGGVDDADCRATSQTTGFCSYKCSPQPGSSDCPNGWRCRSPSGQIQGPYYCEP